jgi:hypothetical protein
MKNLQKCGVAVSAEKSFFSSEALNKKNAWRNIIVLKQNYYGEPCA